MIDFKTGENEKLRFEKSETQTSLFQTQQSEAVLSDANQKNLG